jgi:hypothetical protein
MKYSCIQRFLAQQSDLRTCTNKVGPGIRRTRKQDALQHKCRRCTARQEVNKAANIYTQAAELQRLYSQEGWVEVKHKECAYPNVWLLNVHKAVSL